jgi:hypothetical protein
VFVDPIEIVRAVDEAAQPGADRQVPRRRDQEAGQRHLLARVRVEQHGVGQRPVPEGLPVGRHVDGGVGPLRVGLRAHRPRDRERLLVRPREVVRAEVVAHAVDGQALAKPADPAQLLEHRDLGVALPGQEPGRGEPGRAGPHDGDSRAPVDRHPGHQRHLQASPGRTRPAGYPARARAAALEGGAARRAMLPAGDPGYMERRYCPRVPRRRRWSHGGSRRWPAGRRIDRHALGFARARPDPYSQ